ncbi:hypothetical protein FHY55_08000 [Oceanicola sp. D3]|nr:hypothetical protein FHY55_08000 [Oceanicola sp. D3]
MKPVARMGDQHICGNPNHPPNVIVSGGQAIVDGRPIARVGDACACGAVITQGSSISKDNQIPVAYLGSATQCGPFVGKIVSGSPKAKVQP